MLFLGSIHRQVAFDFGAISPLNRPIEFCMLAKQVEFDFSILKTELFFAKFSKLKLKLKSELNYLTKNLKLYSKLSIFYCSKNKKIKLIFITRISTIFDELVMFCFFHIYKLVKEKTEEFKFNLKNSNIPPLFFLSSGK